MRLTVVLCKQPIKWMLNNKWVQKGKFFQYPISPPQPVVAKGVEVVDAAQEFADKRDAPLEPFVRPDHPLFDPEPKAEDHPDYHDQPIYEYRRSTRVSGGERQMCVLTKTQPFYTLPDCVTSLVGQAEIPDQDELAQRYIMQANVWDPSKDRFPKRFNNQIPGWKFKREFGIRYEKRARILMRGLVRLSQTLGGYYPDVLLDRLIHTDVYLHTHFNYQDKPIHIRDTVEYQVTSRRPLPIFADEETVDASTQHMLPDLYPLLPTLDIEKSHIYKVTDFNGFNGKTDVRHPHTLIFRNKSWPTQQNNAKMLMFLFAQAKLAARHRFGADVMTLPEPVCVQAIGTDGVNFQFGCFQLNTLDVSSENGVKNLVWFDNDNHLYQRIEPKRAMLRNTQYQDYNPAVLQKLLAMYVNGADLSIRSWDHPNEAEHHTETETRTVNTRQADV